MCVCVRIPSTYEDTGPFGLGATLTTSLSLNYHFKDPISKYSHNLRCWALGLQCVNLGGTPFSLYITLSPPHFPPYPAWIPWPTTLPTPSAPCVFFSLPYSPKKTPDQLNLLRLFLYPRLVPMQLHRDGEKIGIAMLSSLHLN